MTIRSRLFLINGIGLGVLAVVSLIAIDHFAKVEAEAIRPTFED